MYFLTHTTYSMAGKDEIRRFPKCCNLIRNLRVPPPSLAHTNLHSILNFCGSMTVGIRFCRMWQRFCGATWHQPDHVVSAGCESPQVESEHQSLSLSLPLSTPGAIHPSVFAAHRRPLGRPVPPPPPASCVRGVLIERLLKVRS